jgi:hypothetical protein
MQTGLGGLRRDREATGMASWPPYGTMLSSGMTDALGVIVETFNDLEASLEHLLLIFMESDMLTNLSITNETSSAAKVHAILSLMSLKQGKEEFGEAVNFALKSFETCRVNRNNVVHFRFAWRKERSRKTDLYRMRARGSRISYTVTLKVSDLRRIADECHSLVEYFDELTSAVGNRLD